ncbi:ATP-binding protein [Kitasatospora sp. NPDC091276]|uniref:ATP-binding protein n=1 Tax=unclassified Kitasatospora TaxID=2633591 RepID=UPI00342409E3
MNTTVASTPALVGGERRQAVHLPYRPESASTARHLVRTVLVKWGLEDLADDAELIVSELVGNASKTGCQLTMSVEIVSITGRDVRIGVTDGCRILPVRVDAGPNAEGGRGLDLVHKLTRGHWGAALMSDGKTVHADLKLRTTQ